MRNLTHTGWNWPLIRGWFAMALLFLVFWTVVLWGTARLIARLLDA
jgi:hypothetical protein